jgi:DNA-binding HxlR family transcriptional regulator/putative sterol carrier protein
MCPVARALDVLGERWTLLVVRELLLGPKRFKDLLTALPAMGTNRLGDRLKSLQAAGVVARRTLPPPAGVQVYELTASGERLRPALYCMGAWGRELPVLEELDPDGVRAELIALGLAGTSPPELSAGLEETYELHIGSECFHVTVADSSVAVRSGPAPVTADLLVECDADTFLALVTGELTPSQAARHGRMSVHGEQTRLTRAFRILSYTHAATDFRLVPA